MVELYEYFQLTLNNMQLNYILKTEKLLVEEHTIKRKHVVSLWNQTLPQESLASSTARFL